MPTNTQVKKDLKNKSLAVKDHNESEASLKETEDGHRLIANHASDLISIIDPTNFCYKYVSPSYKKLLGYNTSEILGSCCLDMVYPDDRHNMLDVLKKGIEAGFGIARYRMLRKDGTEIWVETNGKLMDEEDRNPAILFISRDIRERKEVEKALYDKVNYLNTLIDTMNELFYTIDRNGTITFANQITMNTTGYTLEEGLGRSILDFFPENEREAMREDIQQHVENGGTRCHEHSFICKDGSVLLVREKSSPIIENGKIIGILALAEDITQQRKMEREMARLGQMHLIGEMAASIAHEIRNPMTTVQGFLQMLSQKEQIQEYQAYFELMLEELGRANFIISEFISLAKDKLINLRVQNLNIIVENMAPLLVADALKEDKNICFMLADIPELLLDEKEIRQLILNLVRNGLEAMSARGTITISTALEIDGIVLSVQDEGIGISNEIREQLGTPFVSSKENGIGLGLAVCYSIVNRHNASMNYETGPEGSNFIIRFKKLEGVL